MRKLALLIVIVLSTLLVSCGEEHSPITGPTKTEPNKLPNPDSTATTVPDSTSTPVPDSTAVIDSTAVPVPIPVPDPIPEPTPTTSLLQPVPASDLIEKINFLVNEDFASEHPEMENNIFQMVEDVNAVLAKSGIEKRYALGEVMTYPNAEALYSIRNTPGYFYDNNFVGNSNYGGTTVVYWLQEKWGENAQFFNDMGIAGGAGYTNINGKKYGLVYLTQLKTENPLLGKNNSLNAETYVTGLSMYDAHLSGLLHELGHTLGCGSPEWYTIHCTDNSGTLPNLAFDQRNLYPEDPMSCADVVKYNIQEYKFSPFNSWLIDHNANHQVDNMPITIAAMEMKIQIKVVCSSGPVSNADIKVYCGISSDGGGSGVVVNMETVLQQTKTNRYGVASIDNNGSYIIGVKASCDGKNAGSVITMTDLQKCFVVDELDTFVLTLYLQ